MDGTVRRAVRRAEGFGTAGARATLVMIALVAGGTTARAEAPTLRWKFSQGEVLHYQMDQKTVTELKIAAQNQDIKTTVTQIVETTWTVLSVDASGTAEMSQSIDRLRSKVEANFGTFEFDSKADKQPEGLVAGAMVPVLKAMIGQKFRYKISPQGELSDIQVPESLLKTLKETGPAAGPGMFSEDGLKNMIKESSLILPKESLDKPWTRQKKVPMPPIGSLVLDTTHKYEGTENDQVKVVSETKASVEVDPANKIDAKIASQEGKGAFYFDAKAGRVARSTVTQKVEMVVSMGTNKVSQSTNSETEMKLVPGGAATAK
jgi:Family of unknown function (DUF6263)